MRRIQKAVFHRHHRRLKMKFGKGGFGTPDGVEAIYWGLFVTDQKCVRTGHGNQFRSKVQYRAVRAGRLY